MKRTILLMSLLSLIGTILAVSLQIPVDPDGWQSYTRNGNRSLILNPGAPELPFYPVMVLIPFGEQVEEVLVETGEMRVVREGLTLPYVRQPQPVSLPTPDTTIPNPLIWQRDGLYPDKSFEYLGTQFYRGFQLAVINVYPWRYNPVQRQVTAAEEIRIEIRTSFDASLAGRQANFVANDEGGFSLLQNQALNLEARASYQSADRWRNHVPQSRLIDLSTPRKMIIITDVNRLPWFADYISFRNTSGISTAAFTTADIYANYTGSDNAAKVRNFIIDAYQTWADTATPLEYVILGGDDEVVPERGCYGRVGSTVDNRMPTDIYFSNLDGTWNNNNNNIYGEPSDQVDYLPEVHIGRFTAESQNEFNNIFRKTQYYVQNQTFSNNISIMMGENLNWNPVTWGGDYKDDVALHIPDTYHMERLYQRDGTYSGTAIWNAINGGANVMNHMGHANESSLIGQANNTVNSLENTEYGFLYSQGCYPAAFDQRTSGDAESIGEHLIMASGALFAFLGNTRYGWYMPGSIDGPSQYYDRSYFVGMFENAHTELGKAQTYSRIDNLNSAMSNDVMRWCYYEMVLFGDPSIEVKYPDAMMPYLSLHSYRVSDEEGDNDGTNNPGEIIRIYPRLSNHQNWHTANNVTITLADLPQGAVALESELTFASIPNGQTTAEGPYFRIQITDDAGFGTYNLNLVFDAQHPITNQSIGTRKVKISYDITLLDSRFPWDCEVSGKSSPVVYDFSEDGDLDILFMDVFGNSHYIGNDGQTQTEYPASSELNINRSFAMGYLDGDDTMDIAMGSRTGMVRALRTNGTEIFSNSVDTQFLFTPVIADIDGDGSQDVIIAGLNRMLYAWSNTGSLKPGFPVLLSGSPQTEFACADIVAGNGMEIIIGSSDGKLHVYNGLGQSVGRSFPLQLTGSVKGAPVVLNNGRIAVGTQTKLYLVDSDGSILFERNISDDMAGGAVLADINRDGMLDIVFVTSSGNLCVVDQNGNSLSGFPYAVGTYFTCPPLVADVDADNQYEIVLHDNNNSVYILNHNGTMVPGFPFPLHYSGATPATLVDFDNDGYFKLVTGYANGVVVINMRKPVSTMTPWTVYRGALNRQGSYAATGYVSNEDDLNPPVKTSLLQNYPNPFNPETTIAFTLASDMEISVNIYNLKGQKVKTLFKGLRNSGRHELVFDGKDEQGNPVSSGIYLYRLEGKGINQTRKMLLAK